MTIYTNQLVMTCATPSSWQSAQRWAQQEHWDLGYNDSSHFFTVDPQGFFLGSIEQHAVSAISIANFDSTYAHLGHYLVDPVWRGKGVGLQLWETAINHAGKRCIGLDGMPAQVKNYQRSGFVTHYRTLRITGQPKRLLKSQAVHLTVNAVALSRLIEWDSTIVGYSRSKLLSDWFSGPERWGFYSEDGQGVNGLIGIRKSDAGYRIGPLHAINRTVITNLLEAALSKIPHDECVTIDVPDFAEDMVQACENLGLKILFHTHRMYRGVPPHSDFHKIKALASLELG
ncbi:GNAT family N-acetyltransferase [Pantoea agglomerans]|uniref:GNAT family N-acetyltransferase n=1 Tax=Enterobacter agglomerans TaxID=549 RepID=UPI00320B9E87